MTPIHTLRADLATLKRKGDVTGPLALFLGSVLDRIEALERPAGAIRPGFFDPTKPLSGCSVCYGQNQNGCPACSYIKKNEGAKA